MTFLVFATFILGLVVVGTARGMELSEAPKESKESTFLVTFNEDVPESTRKRCLIQIQVWRKNNRQCPVLPGEELTDQGIRVRWWRHGVQTSAPQKWFQLCFGHACSQANWQVSEVAAACLAEPVDQDAVQVLPSACCEDHYDPHCVEQLLAGMVKPKWGGLTVNRTLGDGAFGVVHLAVLDGVEFAVKSPKRRPSHSALLHDHALFEVTILRLLRGHAHVARLVDVFWENEKINIVTAPGLGIVLGLWDLL